MQKNNRAYLSSYIIIIVWTAAILLLFFILAQSEIENTKDQALKEALGTYNSDTNFRSWAAAHGGFYIPVTEEVSPNPYLENIKEQNIETQSGRNLTLMNPAWAIRSLNEYSSNTEKAFTHITSLKLLRPENAPDEWEEAALQSFEQGNDEVSEIIEISGEPVFRLMKPLIVETGCLKCHQYQGYEVGNIRGGVSVSVQYTPYLELQRHKMQKDGMVLILIYILGLFIIIPGSIVLKRKNLLVIKTQLSLEKEIISSKAVNEELKMEISEHLKSEKEKDRLQSQLSYKNKMDGLGQLAGGIAHDFNNILNGISSSAQLLQLPDKALNDQALKYVNIIIQATDRASNLTEKLLTYSRRDKITFNPINVHKIIDESLGIIKNTIDKKIKIVTEKDAVNSIISGDSNELENALINLIINASQAISGNGEIQIKTENVIYDQSFCDSNLFEIQPGEYCSIEVRDNGCGIPADKLEDIFDPFYTTKGPGEGTGLGLTTVYSVVQNHSGCLEVCSEPGSWTSFKIVFPNTVNTIETKKDTEVKILGTGKILFVDDEEFNRVLGADILESLGYDVIVANNGVDALEKYRENHQEIDIVLLDMIMPEMDGRETFEKLLEFDNDCKVIISSGYAKNENLDEITYKKLSGFIGKPYRISELSQVLAAVKEKE